MIVADFNMGWYAIKQTNQPYIKIWGVQIFKLFSFYKVTFL